MGFVFQVPTLFPHLTVAGNIRFGMGMLPRNEARWRLDELLEQLKLAGLARRYPYQLSGGEARRAELGRALASRPRYLLLDEPLTSLDPALKADLMAHILEVTVGITGLIYVTHDPAEAEQIATRMLFMKNGVLSAGELSEGV
jgi:iron(III) transport system ATP-binding protein